MREASTACRLKARGTYLSELAASTPENQHNPCLGAVGADQESEIGTLSPQFTLLSPQRGLFRQQLCLAATGEATGDMSIKRET